VFLAPSATKETKSTNNNKQKGAWKQMKPHRVGLVAILIQAFIVAVVGDKFNTKPPIMEAAPSKTWSFVGIKFAIVAFAV
jgi:hypothetical protein